MFAQIGSSWRSQSRSEKVIEGHRRSLKHMVQWVHGGEGPVMARHVFSNVCGQASTPEQTRFACFCFKARVTDH